MYNSDELDQKIWPPPINQVVALTPQKRWPLFGLLAGCSSVLLAGAALSIQNIPIWLAFDGVCILSLIGALISVIELIKAHNNSDGAAMVFGGLGFIVSIAPCMVLVVVGFSD